MQWGTVQRILSGLVHFHVVQTLHGKAVGSIRYSIGYNRIRYKRPQQAIEVVLKGLHTSARQCRRSIRYNGIRYNRWQATAAVLSRFAHLHVVQTLQGKTRFNTTQWDTTHHSRLLRLLSQSLHISMLVPSTGQENNTAQPKQISDLAFYQIYRTKIVFHRLTVV